MMREQQQQQPQQQEQLSVSMRLEMLGEWWKEERDK